MRLPSLAEPQLSVWHNLQDALLSQCILSDLYVLCVENDSLAARLISCNCFGLFHLVLMFD